jgi:uncharacterized OB-fold protein
MLVCSKCGTQNEFGRVFCGRCGTKLELTDVTTEALVEEYKWEAYLAYWPYVAALVLLIIVGVVGMAFWAQTELLGEKGTRFGGQRVATKLEQMKRMGGNQTLKVDFPEKDINGYFEFFKPKGVVADSVSVGVSDTAFTVRIVRKLGSMGVAKIRVEPTVSYDFVCVPVGERVAVSQAKMGHLPLVGPLRTSAIRSNLKVFSSQAEWQAFQNVSTLQIANKAVVMELRK